LPLEAPIGNEIRSCKSVAIIIDYYYEAQPLSIIIFTSQELKVEVVRDTPMPFSLTSPQRGRASDDGSQPALLPRAPKAAGKEHWPGEG
jgi:hypothetical protein